MKKLLLLLIVTAGLQTFTNAQYVAVPDANLRAYLKLTYASCFNASNQMDTTCSIKNIDWVSISGKDIYSLEGLQYLRKIDFLDCSNNHLTSLPRLSNTITYLNAAGNNISSITNLPSRIKAIFFNDNNLTYLLPLPDSIINIYVDNNKLTSLPVLTPFTQEVHCGNNKLTSLPLLPNGMKVLYCFTNQLNVLPRLPDSLTTLHCEENKLSYLPALPNLVNILFCGNNRLTALPALPDSLFQFDCSNNQLTSLPALPDTLNYLNVSHNQLVSLPLLPRMSGMFSQLAVSYNQLTSLPSLGINLMALYCDHNPLGCLPLLPPHLFTISLKSTNISCMPATSATKDTTIVACVGASGLCNVNAMVQGKIYLDSNNNNQWDSSETLLSQQIVKVLPNNWVSASDIYGNYVIKIDTVINNTWSAISTNRYATITPGSYSLSNIHTLGLANNNSYDFRFHLPSNVYDLETKLGSSPARPGFTTIISVAVNNVGTVNQSTITVKLKKPSGYNVLSTSVAPSFTINDTLVWNNVSINLLNSKSFIVQLQVPAGATIGTSAVYEAWATSSHVDSTPVDNYVTWTETIRGSFDPNDKLVNKNSLPPTYNANTDKLTYTIRFQNTGTDTAFTVIVRDIIPGNLDLTSLRVVNSSHPYQLIVRDKNIVEIAFPNIQLPASITNEAKSHGFVQLEFKPKAGLALNDSINNKASILFDYNLPVITNTATTKVQIVTGIANNKNLAFKLFPNPTSENITVELPYSGIGKWDLMDISGKTIKQNKIENGIISFDINVNDVANGIYFLSLEMNGTVSTSKVVITR